MTAAKPKRTLRKASKKYPGVYERIIDGHATGKFSASYHDPATHKKAWVKGGPWMTVKAAADARTQRIAQVASGATVRGSVTVRAFHDDVYRPWYEATKKPGAASSNRYSLKPFIARFGSQQMNNLDEEAIRQWGLACPLNNARAARAFLYRAKANRLLRDNPLARLGRAESRGRADVDVITEEELLDLADSAVEALGPHYGPVFAAHILFSAYTCMRPAEVAALLKVNVLKEAVRVRDNISGGVIVPSPKNGQWRKILLPPPARRALQGMPQNPDSAFVFWAKRGQHLSKSTQFEYWNTTRVFHAARTGNSAWLDKDFYEVTRHFGAAFLLNVLLLPPEHVAFQLGHTGQTGSDLVLRLYGHPDHELWRQRMLDAWEAYEADQQTRQHPAGETARLRLVR